MSAAVTLSLPDHVLRRAQLAARRAGRPVADVLAEAIELSFNPLATPSEHKEPMAHWSDVRVLTTADSQMLDSEDARLSELLDRQQACKLTHAERGELTA